MVHPAIVIELKPNWPGIAAKIFKKAATEADIKTAIAQNIEQAVAGVAGQIRASAQRTVWEQYATGHQDSFFRSHGSDRDAAWSNIHGDNPRGNKEYTRFRNDHTNPDYR